MKIFLDDIRTPPGKDWELSKSAQDCVTHLNTGKVTHLSLDHDLGEDLTGYDVLVWLERYIVDNPEFKIPAIFIHTANPVGRQKMIAALNKIHKLRNINDGNVEETTT